MRSSTARQSSAGLEVYFVCRSRGKGIVLHVAYLRILKHTAPVARRLPANCSEASHVVVRRALSTLCIEGRERGMYMHWCAVCIQRTIAAQVPKSDTGKDLKSSQTEVVSLHFSVLLEEGDWKVMIRLKTDLRA